MTAKKDLWIYKFGARYLKSHREKHVINVCSHDALQPKYFDLFVKASKIVANSNEVTEVFGSPTYARNIQLSLKQCCSIAVLCVLRQKYQNSTLSSAEAEANFKTYKHLLEIGDLKYRQ